MKSNHNLSSIRSPIRVSEFERYLEGFPPAEKEFILSGFVGLFYGALGCGHRNTQHAISHNLC